MDTSFEWSPQDFTSAKKPSKQKPCSSSEFSLPDQGKEKEKVDKRIELRYLIRKGDLVGKMPEGKN